MWRFLLLIVSSYFVSAYRPTNVLLDNGLGNNDVIDVSRISQSCNHRHTNQTFGILTSPNYPLGYRGNITCTWSIEMAEGERVALTIKKFYLGPEDSLELVEKNAVNTYSLANPPEEVIFTRTKSVTVILRGFETTAAEASNRTFYSIFEREGCGGVHTLKNGYIQVPSYIYMSPSSHQCSWTILAPQNKVIVLQFLQFDLPPGSCLYSSIRIREGSKQAGYMLGDFCEENPPMNQLRSSSNIVEIEYRTRPNFLDTASSDMIPAVKMYYSQEDACGGVLDGASGSFALPRRWLDGVYACNWTLRAPRGKHIQLRLKDVRVTPVSKDEYDQIVFVIPSTGVVYWSSAGNKQPPESLIVPSDNLVVMMTSHRNATSQTMISFYALYQAMTPSEDQCIDVAGRQIFVCDEWKYIDCSLRCDGVFDCHNKKDEAYCVLDAGQQGSNKMQHSRELKRADWTGYLVAMFSIGCVVVVIAFVSITMDRFCRREIMKAKEDQHSKAYYAESILRPSPYIGRDSLTPHNPSASCQRPVSVNIPYYNPHECKPEIPRFASQRNLQATDNRLNNTRRDLNNRSTLSLNAFHSTNQNNDTPYGNDFSITDNRPPHCNSSACINSIDFSQAKLSLSDQRLTPNSSRSEIHSAWEYLFPDNNQRPSQSAVVSQQKIDEEKSGDDKWNYESDFEECSSTTITNTSSSDKSTDKETSDDAAEASSDAGEKQDDDAVDVGMDSTRQTTDLFHDTDVLGSTSDYLSTISSEIIVQDDDNNIGIETANKTENCDNLREEKSEKRDNLVHENSVSDFNIDDTSNDILPNNEIFSDASSPVKYDVTNSPAGEDVRSASLCKTKDESDSEITTSVNSLE